MGLEAEARRLSLTRQVLGFLDCHRPKPKQIRLVKALVYSFSLRVEVCHQNLSKRQEECLTLALHHLTAKQTAGILGISPNTVKKHWYHARRKLNCQRTIH